MTATEIPVAAPHEKPKAREPLSRAEQTELVKQERLVEFGFLHMRNCAEALRVIRDKRLYRAQFDTFQEYCEKKWKRERATVNLFLQAWEVREDLANVFAKNDPAKSLLEETSDRAARELGKVDPANRIKVFEQAAEHSNGRPPTAETIRSFIEAGQKASKAVAEAELGLSGESTKPKKPEKHSRRNSNTPAPAAKETKPRKPARVASRKEWDGLKKRMAPVGLALAAYDEWQDARAKDWQRDFGVKAWRAYNERMFDILREVRGWWENRIKSEAGI